MSTLIEALPGRDMGRPDSQVPRPGEAEQRLLKRLILMFEAADEERKKFTKFWPISYKYYMGDQWSPMRPSWKSSPVENHIFAKVETVLPILTDSSPKIDVLPRTGQTVDYADMLQQLLEHLWDKNDLDMEVVLACKNCLLFGKGFFYTYYDEDDQQIVTRSVNPQNIYPDPDATNLRNARYLIHVDVMSRTDVEATWPTAIGKTRRGTKTFPDPDKFKDGVRNSNYVDNFSGYEYPETSGGSFSRIVPWVTADLSDGSNNSDICQVAQFWIREPELIEEELKDPENGEILTYANGEPIWVEKPKYPNGRHIVVVGDRIVHDSTSPFDHAEWPYTELNCHPFPGEFWPVSMVQNMISPQRSLNKMNGLIIDNAKLVGSGIWKIEKGAGPKARQLVGRPGMVVTYNRGFKVEREPGTPLPNFISQIPDALRSVLDAIPGVHDVTTGRKPAGITAGVAIESLQEAAQTRVRLLVRNLENFLKNTGQQQIALAQQYFKEAKLIRTVDEMGNFAFKEMTPDMIRGGWEVIVAAGSSIPRNREARERQSLALLEAGIFQPEDVIDWIDHPGKYKVLRRQKQVAAMQAELGTLADQGGGGAPGGGAAANLGPQPSPKPQVAGRGFGQAGPPRL